MTGTVNAVQIELGDDDHEHLITPYALDVDPLGLAVEQLGNIGTARTLLKAWPLTA